MFKAKTTVLYALDAQNKIKKQKLKSAEIYQLKAYSKKYSEY
jgi:hypothetical protein